MERIIQQKMNESQTPLVDVFAKLHNLCLSLQIEVLHDQIERLMRERLANFIKIKDHVSGQELAITYWGGSGHLVILAVLSFMQLGSYYLSQIFRCSIPKSTSRNLCGSSN